MTKNRFKNWGKPDKRGGSLPSLFSKPHFMVFHAYTQLLCTLQPRRSPPPPLGLRLLNFVLLMLKSWDKAILQ